MYHLLADETVLRIFGFLDAKDLVRLQLVSKHLRTLAKDRHLWKRLFYLSFVRPAGGALNGQTSSSTLPTLRELRSLLLHQNLLSGKHVAGDGHAPIHRLPSRYYGTSSNSSSATVSHHDADNSSSSFFLRALDLDDTSADHLLDWEQIYRVSANWARGHFVASELPMPRTRDGPPPRSLRQTLPHPHTVVRVSNHFILTATSADGESNLVSPTISVYPSETSQTRGSNIAPSDLYTRKPALRFTSPGLQRLLQASSSDNIPAQVHVTEIAVDAASDLDAADIDASDHPKRKLKQSEASSSGSVVRVLVAYSTGHISLFSLYPGDSNMESVEDVFQMPKLLASGDHIAMAALHTPALVLCSSKFDLAFYRISTAPNVRIDLVHRLSSYRCSWPASLRLKKLPYHHASKRPRRPLSASSADRSPTLDGDDEAAFRVTLAYSTPTYPTSWSVSVQELVIRLHIDSAASTPAAHVTSRHATAKHPFTPTPIDPRGRSMLDWHHNSSSRATRDADWHLPESSRSTSLTYDDPFVVLGASDNLVEVYELLGATTFVRPRLHDPVASASRSATATPPSQRHSLRLVHRRSLHGHTGSVHSVALEDGRCVSGGADGSVMVWSLGDRSNETESIASAMRQVRATARNFERHGHAKVPSAKSTNSAILEEEEGEAAARHMAHVLTLRSPTTMEDAQLSCANNENPAGQGTSVNAQLLGPSLGQIVQSRRLDRQARGVIRWVSTAFDKIVSIVSYADAATVPSLDAQHPRERVQVWSFG